MSLIDNLPHDAVVSRPLKRGVRRLWRNIQLVVTQIQYLDMLGRLFARIGAQLGVSIERYSFDKWESHEYRAGDLTYDTDSAFQVTICLWQETLNHHCEPVTSPTPIVSPEEEAAFEKPLRDAVEKLLRERTN